MAVISYTGAYDEYQKMEALYGEGHNRKCIDGRTTGCGKCVGYCKYAGHPGFLTENQRSSHNCIGNECKYYIPKPERIRKTPKKNDPAKMVLDLVRDAVSDMEGLKVTRVRNDNGSWVASYVTISNDYQLDQIVRNVHRQSGMKIRFNRLNLDFDICAQIVMGV